MAALTETVHAGAFVVSDLGTLSWDSGIAGATLVAGQVVKVSTGKYVSYDGSGDVVGIVRNDCVLNDPVALMARLGEVYGDSLTSTEQTDGTIDTGAVAGLLALNIIVR